MKKLYVLLAAAFFMFITGCGGSDEAPLSSEKAITAFKITNPDAIGVITEATHTIAVTVPNGTLRDQLVATFTTTGASVKVGLIVQKSGETENDFSDPVVYTVTAADSSTQDYTVTVTVSPLSGSLDTTFGTSGGKVTTIIGSGNYVAVALGIQPDDPSNFKIVVAGRFCDNSVNINCTNDSSKHDFVLARYNKDGTLDTNFGTGGTVTTSIGSGNDDALALGIQPDDGKIVLAGRSTNGSKYDFALVRYNTDGSLDETFGTGGKVTTSIGSGNDEASALGIQYDGKIVVTGISRDTINNKYDFALVRYNTDGSLDETFGTGGKVTTSIGNESNNAFARALDIYPVGTSDFKIVVAGYYNNGSNYDFALARYNTDGSLDETFNAAGTKPGTVTTSIGSGSDSAYALRIQPDGKIVVAGSSSNGSNYFFALARYNTDGSLDETFDTDGKVITPIGSGFASAYALGIDTDNKILAAGYSNNGSNYDFALARYDENGTLDPGFGTGGIVTTPVGNSDDYALALGIQPDGRIVTAGFFNNGSTYDFALVRYLSQ